MRIHVVGGIIAASAILAACRDAQTEEEVETKTATGEVATSMSGDSADKRGMALVRVVNAAATNATLIVRAEPHHALTEAEFKEVTDYQPIDRNWVTFEVSTSSRQRV